MIATKTAKKGGIILKKRKKDVSSMLGVVCVCGGGAHARTHLIFLKK